MKKIFLIPAIILTSLSYANNETKALKAGKNNKEETPCTITIKETIDGREHVATCTRTTCQAAFDCASASIRTGKFLTNNIE